MGSMVLLLAVFLAVLLFFLLLAIVCCCRKPRDYGKKQVRSIFWNGVLGFMDSGFFVFIFGAQINIKELVHLYKSKVLGFIEFRTGAIYHASECLLHKVDNLQRSFLSQVGLTEEEAMFEHNISPLQTRGDIALLGVIHRAALGKGPVHFKKVFKLAETL